MISAAQSTGLDIQVIQDLLDNQRTLNGRDYSNRAATVIADCELREWQQDRRAEEEAAEREALNRA